MALSKESNPNGHLGVHAAEKVELHCNYCETDFLTDSDHKIHMRKHTGEKSYQCRYCDSSFSDKFKFLGHTKTHKPHLCEYCGETFSNNDALALHLRKHTMKFQAQSSSTEHMFKHPEKIEGDHGDFYSNMGPHFDAEYSVSDYADTDEDQTSEEEISDDENVSAVTCDGFYFVNDCKDDSRPEPYPNFIGHSSGIPDQVPRFKSPGEAFKAFFDKKVISHLNNCTNQMAEEYFSKEDRSDTNINGIKWCQVDENSMYVFIALLMVMGIHKMPNISMYWSNHVMWGGPKIFCQSVMSRNRFASILKFLRFSQILEMKKRIPNTFIEPFLDLLRQRCKELCHPGLHVAIAESLVLMKGNLSYKQSTKPMSSHSDIKVLFLCPSDSHLSGFSYNFEIYHSQNSNEHISQTEGLSKTEGIVISLMKDLLDEGRHVVTDHRYTSLKLGEYLMSRGTTLTGNVHNDLRMSSLLKRDKLQKHEALFRRKGNILICKYRDKRKVQCLTTRYQADFVPISEMKGGGHKKPYKQPLQIYEYDKLMSSSNRAHQILEPYSNDRKHMAWFKTLGIYFINRMLLNSYLLYRHQHQDYKKDFLGYMQDVAEELIGIHSKGGGELIMDYYVEKRPNPNRNNSQGQTEAGKSEVHQSEVYQSEPCQRPIVRTFHTLAKIPPRENGTKPQKRCRQCSYENKPRKETRNYCPKCETGPGLCSVECYDAYHSRILPEDPYEKSFIQSNQTLVSEEPDATFPSQATPEHSTNIDVTMCNDDSIDVKEEPLDDFSALLCNEGIVDKKSSNKGDDMQNNGRFKTDGTLHTLEKIPPKENRMRTVKRCRQCSYEKKQRKETQNYCPKCDKAPGLCSIDCFNAYHSRILPGNPYEKSFTQSNQTLVSDKPDATFPLQTTLEHSTNIDVTMCNNDNIDVKEEPLDDFSALLCNEEIVDRKPPNKGDDMQNNGIFKSDRTFHALATIPPTENKMRPQRRCHQCSYEKRPRKDTRYYCPKCDKAPGLCGNDCFNAYHSRMLTEDPYKNLSKKGKSRMT